MNKFKFSIEEEINARVDALMSETDASTLMKNTISRAFIDEGTANVSFEAIARKGRAFWKQQPNFGKKSLAKLESILSLAGLSFGSGDIDMACVWGG